MKKHKFNIFPEMQADDYERLKADIAANGYDESMPITVYQGDIIDGWNRYRACNELNTKPKIEQFAGSDTDAIEFVMRTNKRRNLNSSQWACIAAEAEEMIVAIAAAVESERRKKQAETQSETMKKPITQLVAPQVPSNKRRNLTSSQWACIATEAEEMLQTIAEAVEAAKAEKNRLAAIQQHSGGCDNKLTDPQPTRQPERVTQKAAEVFNTNRTYISEAAKLKEEKPEVFEQVKRGEKTITEVKKEAKVEKRKADIQAQKDAIENGTVQMPVGVFEVISLDPPWNYGREYDPDGSRVANPYPEMTQAQLLELKPPFADNSVCFLWTTQAFIWQAKELLDKWGFTYKATIVWDKEKIGMGAWLRMQCEFCLVGIKGKPAWNNTSWRDIIRESRREHSRKPDTFYRMVEEITIGRRLEYFSREQRKGWEVFGNDTEKF